jgi:glutamyl-tRNA synthetase
MHEDLAWLDFSWIEGPDRGGPFGPYNQSKRMTHYREALLRLRAGGFVYPCRCSRKDILSALQAPHAGDEEPVYPGTCRPPRRPSPDPSPTLPSRPEDASSEHRINWRFRVPEGERIQFTDALAGPQIFQAGKDFGDFVVWRGDGLPAYQLAVVVDDAAMEITEVVRGADLLVSTARQLLLYRALGWRAPAFCHCPLMTDEAGQRLAKRHDALSLRTLRQRGESAQAILASFERSPTT